MINFLIFLLFCLTIPLCSETLCAKKSYQKTKLQEWIFYEKAFENPLSMHNDFVTQKEKKGKLLCFKNKKNSSHVLKGKEKDFFIGVGLLSKSNQNNKEDMKRILKEKKTVQNEKKIEKIKLTTQKIKKSYSILMKGILTIGNRKKVCFENKKKTYLLSEKESRDGFFVDKINDNSVCFIINKKKVIIQRKL